MSSAMFKSVFFLVPYLLLFPINISFSADDRCSQVFMPAHFLQWFHLTTADYWSSKQSRNAGIQPRRSFKREHFSHSKNDGISRQKNENIELFWFKNLVKGFGGDEQKAKQHIVDQLVEGSYSRPPKLLKGWPSYPAIMDLFPDIGKEFIRRMRQKNQ